MSARLDLIGVVVADMARSVAFYRRLGLDFPPGAEEQPHAEAPLPGGLRFALDTEDVVRSFDPEWERPDRGHHVGAFLVESPAAVDHLFEELVGEGYEPHKQPWNAFWGQRYAQVRDPDGNIVDLFAPLPEQPAPEAN